MNRKLTPLSLVASCLLLHASLAASPKGQPQNYIETETFSQEENDQILKLYANLRVADVSDGMDSLGFVDTGLVDPAIHPDWVDRSDLSHIIRGIAVTARYVPTQRRAFPEEGQSFTEWRDQFYGNYSSEPFTDHLFPGSVVVLDDVESADVGSIGSNNIMIWKERGAVGVVTDASARDTDEVAIQKIPLYLRQKGRGIRPGRNEIESINRPIVVGGVLVMPGDVVVADGDGVIVVPRKHARQVAEHAHGVLATDKAERRKLYESLGIPIDSTVD
ncbi:RraA family protein [Pelagicoccus mobilis]|uniref:Dimethylmenaquinone methyltransferase n=1 Tax=Pelagicoccus mobilis TaxID=415221 RepID=A0A934S514_9BACT|nr:hypothetical protein [Pelagicoccus mobilis]MBK1879108.1 hypothetical protein [Pelagicoccus mobilis]